jgi:hypothetical protein
MQSLKCYVSKEPTCRKQKNNGQVYYSQGLIKVPSQRLDEGMTSVIKDIVMGPSLLPDRLAVWCWYSETVLTGAVWRCTCSCEAVCGFSMTWLHRTMKKMSGSGWTWHIQQVRLDVEGWLHGLIRTWNFRGFFMWWHLKHIYIGKSRSCGKTWGICDKLTPVY